MYSLWNETKFRKMKEAVNSQSAFTCKKLLKSPSWRAEKTWQDKRRKAYLP